MRLLLLTLGASFFASLLPATAAAQAPPSSSTAATGESRPRVRFGLAGGLAAGAALPKGRASTIPYFGPTLQLDLGVQVSDSVAMYLHGEAGTWVLLNHAAAYAIGEWTPVPWLSVGTGIGYDAIAQFISTCGGCSSSPPSWVGLSVPLIPAINLARYRSPGRADRVLRLALPLAAGINPEDARVGVHGAVTVGWAVM